MPTYLFHKLVCQTVRPMLSDRCLSALSVCDVDVLWPYCWMDQDATWYGGRPGPTSGHIVLDGDPAPPHKGTQQPFPLFGPCLLWPNGWMD